MQKIELESHILEDEELFNKKIKPQNQYEISLFYTDTQEWFRIIRKEKKLENILDDLDVSYIDKHLVKIFHDP